MSAAEEIRADPSRFLRDWETRGALAVLQDLLACCLIEIVPRLPDPELHITLASPTAFRISDNGRGMNFALEPGHPVSHVEYVLTHLYPIPCPSEELEGFLRTWTWGERSCRGPVIGNALAERFRVESQRDDERWAQDFSAGLPASARYPVDPTSRGTTLSVELDDQILGDRPRLELSLLEDSFHDLRSMYPNLVVRLEER